MFGNFRKWDKTPRSTHRELSVERLEGRDVPATFNVTDVASLTAAINTSNGNGEANVINLAANTTFDLTTVDHVGAGADGLPTIAGNNGKSLTIHGNGAVIERDSATATPAFRIFEVANIGSTLSIDHVTIANGLAADNNGGGVRVDYSGRLTLSDVTITGNSATGAGGNGGGLAAQYNATVSIADSTITGNTAGKNGGGVSFDTPANGIIQGSTISGNSAGKRGGGVSFYRSGVGLIQNSTISGNTADRGGGVAFYGMNSGKIQNSTITGNVAKANNRAGGGVYFYSFRGPLFIQSTILANNFENTTTANDIENGGGTLNADHDLIKTLPSGVINGTNSNNVIGGDPLLGPLADNGGPTQTELLSAGSPAIGAGSNPQLLATDQRGFARAGSNGLGATSVDIGAVDFDAVAPTAALGSAPNVDQNSNPNTYTFAVVYRDNQAVAGSSLASGNLVVSGPNGFAAYAILVSVDQPGNGSPRTATYNIAAPGNAFTSTVNGTYSISVQPNQVKDLQGNSVAASVLGTFQVNIPAPPLPPPPPDDFVRALYRDVLHREADARGLDGYIDLLRQGATREWVARDIWESAEHHAVEFQDFVARYLGRSIDAAALTRLQQSLPAGALDEALQAAIAGSADFRAIHSSNADFVEAQYRVTLGRGSDARGEQGYIDLLAAGRLDGKGTASSFIASEENHRILVDAFYAAFLHRTAETSGRNSYVDLLEAGFGYENTAVSIFGSDEYFRLHRARY